MTRKTLTVKQQAAHLKRLRKPVAGVNPADTAQVRAATSYMRTIVNGNPETYDLSLRLIDAAVMLTRAEKEIIPAWVMVANEADIDDTDASVLSRQPYMDVLNALLTNPAATAHHLWARATRAAMDAEEALKAAEQSDSLQGQF